ncbi:MAG: enoyl-CoA hydratase-related protein, partial [Gammaproteobacteria bacterium]
MSFETLLYEVRDHAALVTFNRPEKLNTWNGTVAQELSQALQDAQDDNAVRAVVLTGA